MSPERRGHQGGGALRIGGIDVGAACQQRAHHRGTIRCRCRHQRRHPVLVGCGQVGAGRQQGIDNSSVPGLRGQQQRRRAVLIGGDIRAGRDQRRDDIRMAIQRGDAQRRHVSVVRFVHCRLRRQGGADVGHVPEHRALKEPHRGFVKRVGRRRRDCRLSWRGALRERDTRP